VSLGRAPAIRKATVKLAHVAPGEKVLDVGCGTGSLAIDAKGKAGPAGEVHGIDAAPEMIEVARQKAGKKGVDVGFRVGLIEDIPFPDGQFDVVLNSFVLHHLPHDLKRKGFAEIHRVLKPGGRFLAADFGPPAKGVIRHVVTALAGHGMMHKDATELAAMMEDAGFTEVEEVKTKYKQLLFVRAKAEKRAGTAEV
jgi:demethylmenaquinone methyltransferase/2-methoxy-6-polyprenyl-1,4-benzoquinol methylase/phosphoethanolamine N-methyltransferase